jgi:hypothetical protein
VEAKFLKGFKDLDSTHVMAHQCDAHTAITELFILKPAKPLGQRHFDTLLVQLINLDYGFLTI